MLTALPAFAALESEARILRSANLADMLADAERGRALVYRGCGLRIDNARQRVTPAVMTKLI